MSLRDNKPALSGPIPSGAVRAQAGALSRRGESGHVKNDWLQWGVYCSKAGAGHWGCSKLKLGSGIQKYKPTDDRCSCFPRKPVIWIAREKYADFTMNSHFWKILESLKTTSSGQHQAMGLKSIILKAENFQTLP